MFLWRNRLLQNVNKTQNIVEIESAHLLFVHNLCVDLPLQLVVNADTHGCIKKVKKQPVSKRKASESQENYCLRL